jgi:two-component SAPR family response regulator
LVSDKQQDKLIVEAAYTMSIKKFIFFMIFIAYTAYYAVIFFGLVKKDYIVEDESATILQKAVAFITPQSPLDRNKEVREQINILNQHISVEQENLSRYEEWRAKAIANPPA